MIRTLTFHNVEPMLAPHKELIERVKPRTVRMVLREKDLLEQAEWRSPNDTIFNGDVWYMLPIRIGSLRGDGLAKSLGVNWQDASNLFINAWAKPEDTICTELVRQAAEWLRQRNAAGLGFRSGVSFSPPQGGAFFPFVRHAESSELSRPRLSIGLELVGKLCALAWEWRGCLSELRAEMSAEIASEIRYERRRIIDGGRETSAAYEVLWDLSLAPDPYPTSRQSVAELFELIGNIGRARSVPPYRFGDAGTLFINTWLTGLLKNCTPANSIGMLNGVMLSPMEDELLAERMDQGVCSVGMLQALSSTCGIGLDMIPLAPRAGRSTALESLLLDTWAQSKALGNKPLGVRPIISNELEGELTSAEHRWIINMRVLESRRGLGLPLLPAQQNMLNSKVRVR